MDARLLAEAALTAMWAVSEAGRLLEQRAHLREWRELLDRVQAGTLGDFRRHQVRPEKAKRQGGEEATDAAALIMGVGEADVVGARASFRRLTEGEE